MTGHIEREPQPRPDIIHEPSFARTDVRLMTDQWYSERIHNPMDNPEATEQLGAQLETWKSHGDVVVFTSGVYDILHANHRAFLLHCKLEGARFLYERFDESAAETWAELPQQERWSFALQTHQHQKLRLVVSIDGNDAVAVRKGYDPEKGGAPRPVYDWSSRARDVLDISMGENPMHAGPVVDAVTLHDKEVPKLQGTPHDDITSIAAWTRPDIWAYYGESTDVRDALTANQDGMFDGIQAVEIPDQIDYYQDSILGGPFGTSQLVKRLRE